MIALKALITAAAAAVVLAHPTQTYTHQQPATTASQAVSEARHAPHPPKAKRLPRLHVVHVGAKLKARPTAGPHAAGELGWPCYVPVVQWPTHAC